MLSVNKKNQSIFSFLYIKMHYAMQFYSIAIQNMIATRVPNLKKFPLVVVAGFSGSPEKFLVVVAISVASH